VDCVLSEWEDWGDCSAKCGGGVVTRERHVSVPPSNGGKTCGGTLKESQSCNDTPCVRKEDCLWGGKNFAVLIASYALRAEGRGKNDPNLDLGMFSNYLKL
jgi:hypothetical protein